MTVLKTISPTTNEAIISREEATQDQINDLAAASTVAFEQWRTTPLSERQACVSRALAILDQRKDELGYELTEQMGRPITYTSKEIATAVQRGEYLVRISGQALSRTKGEHEAGFQRFIEKCPVGPVLVLFAWNTPKVVEQIHDIFQQAGLPQNVLQFLHCGNFEKIESLILSDHIKLVCFTGSVEAGLRVQQTAAKRVIPVVLELGGKDPAYVREDVDVDWAAEEIVDGAIFNSGQSCCSIERVYVASRIHDAFIQAVQRILMNYRYGSPFDKETQIGPVISQRAVQTINDHIADATRLGATDSTPPNQSFSKLDGKGNYVKATLLVNVTHDMKVMRDETFGPVIPVMRVASDEEAIQNMNDSNLGLTASIWTKDVVQGENLARRVEAGTCFVNRCDYPSPDLAWTGWKDSGRGVSLSKFGFEQYVKLKSYHVKSYPVKGVS